MSAPEKRDLLLLGMDLSAGLKMIVGIATSSVTEAIWSAKQAAKAGAEAVLVMPPSYFTGGEPGWDRAVVRAALRRRGLSGFGLQLSETVGDPV